MEDIIISLKSAKSKPKNPYSLNKQTNALHDTLDALRLALCCMRQKSELNEYAMIRIEGYWKKRKKQR